MIGPYKVTRTIKRTVCELELPEDMKIHNVFHTSLLHLENSKPLPGQILPPPEPVVVETDEGEVEEWLVDEILDYKKVSKRSKKVRYLVKWTGFDRPNWEPEAHMEGC